MDESGVIASLAILLMAALVGGMIAHRLRQPIILGYLVIGAAIGPHALGWVSDQGLVQSVATIGVALLMFTLGLEVSVTQLRQVGRVGLWGGLAQIALTAAAGLAVGYFGFKWPLAQSAIFGMGISLSSTMVCLKILMDRGEVDSTHGRIMVAVLILQDISVVGLVLLESMLGAGGQSPLWLLAVAIGKAVIFVAIAIAAGLWVVPWLLGNVGGVRTRELFLITVVVLCLAAALGTSVLGLSVVFGAFVVGLVIRESRFASQVLAEVTPLRDIFATLFFVSLGMLLDLRFVADHWVSGFDHSRRRGSHQDWCCLRHSTPVWLQPQDSRLRRFRSLPDRRVQFHPGADRDQHGRSHRGFLLPDCGQRHHHHAAHSVLAGPDQLAAS